MLIVILRRILLVSILAGPQWFWITEALSLTSRVKSQGIRWLANGFPFFAVIVMALVLYNRIAMRVLPRSALDWVGKRRALLPKEVLRRPRSPPE